jgi:conjugal transfer pilus assembly protein TrbC
VSASDRTSSWSGRTRSAFVAGLQACLSAALPILANAQPAQALTSIVPDADVARSSKTQPVITDQDIERAARNNRMPTDAELARVPVPAPPRLDALPQPLTQRRIDLGAIAKGYEAMARPAPQAAFLGDGPTLLVFVSFSMPDATLARLVDQAARARATLVLRGLVDGSLQKTVLRAQRLIGQRKVGFQIDPQAFDRFSITATPTFVLLKAGAVAAPCAAGTCFPASSFVAAAGDVSIDYALEYFARAAPSFSRDAGAVLATLKRGAR